MTQETALPDKKEEHCNDKHAVVPAVLKIKRHPLVWSGSPFPGYGVGVSISSSF
jgi:hypothetical protein